MMQQNEIRESLHRIASHFHRSVRTQVEKATSGASPPALTVKASTRQPEDLIRHVVFPDPDQPSCYS